MKTFEDLQFRQHNLSPYFESQAVMHFDNGYGVSVITGRGANASQGTYEVAVLFEGDLCYTSGLTTDVLGYQTKAEVSMVMVKLQFL
jgi:hypothetical protein